MSSSSQPRRARQPLHRLAIAVVLAAGALSLGATCEPQDFEELPQVLVVDSEAGRVVDRADPITHGRVTRHIVDYEVTNSSAVGSEVVVSATSLVNGTERASGLAVLAVDAGNAIRGRLTDFELEYGDELRVELQCCSASTCRPTQVLCPTADGMSSTPLICMERCLDPDTSSLLDACVESCPDVDECSALCADDMDCLSACLECQDGCYRTGVSCMATCQTLHRRCQGESPPDVDPEAMIPCDACGGTMGGLCRTADLACGNLDCSSGYPAVCATICYEQFPDDRQGRFDCTSSCIRRVQATDACDFDPSAVDPNAEVPCCYAEACSGRMEAVLKLGQVECFQDSVCGAGRQCNERGLCENKLREEQTSCSAVPVRSSSQSPLWLLAIALGYLAWRARHHAALLLPGLVALILVGISLIPAEVTAEPRGFRRTRSSIVIGLSTSGFAGGPAGSVIKEGVGLSVQETIQSGYFGGTVRLGTAIYSTVNPSLPFDAGVQAYFLAVGPRFVIPTLDSFDLYVFIQPEYQFTSLNSNTATSVTKNANVQHGVGGTAGLQMILGGTGVIELSGGYQWFFPMESGAYTVILGAGFGGLL